MIEYLLHVVVLIAIYAMLAASLDLLFGQIGLLSLAHGAFAAVGAYTSGLLAVNTLVTVPVGLLAGMALAAALSLVVSFASVRLHDDYFAVATFGLHVIVSRVLNNWLSVTGGPLGISGIPRAQLSVLPLQPVVQNAIAAVVLASIAWFVLDRVTRSPFGRVLRIIRGSTLCAETLGKNSALFKMRAVALAAAVAALAGGLFAHHVTYVDPSSFLVTESVLILAMVAIGGTGTRLGPLLGALLLVVLPEMLRFVGLPADVAFKLRQLVYGIAIVVIAVYLPRGLAGRRAS